MSCGCGTTSPPAAMLTGGGTKMKTVTKKSLYDLAKRLDIPNRSKMDKSQLAAAIKKKQTSVKRKLK
jgi:hypothetical protein